MDDSPDVFDYEVEKVNVDKFDFVVIIDLGAEGHGAIARSPPQAEVVVVGSKYILVTLIWTIILT